MAVGSGVSGSQPTAEYVSRPTLGSLLSKDVFLFASVSSIIVIWVVYFVLINLASDDASSQGDDFSQTELLVMFLVMTAADIGLLAWRIRTLSAFVNRGIEVSARIVGTHSDGSAIVVDYEYSYQGATLKGGRGLGGFATQEKAKSMIGRDITVLINPDNPKRTLVLSKLK